MIVSNGVLTIWIWRVCSMWLELVNDYKLLLPPSLTMTSIKSRADIQCLGHHLRIYKRDSGINVKEDGVIQVIGLKWWLPFLRCSGRRVSRLKVAYKNVPDACFEFRGHCISLYCADTLETILVKNFSKPFEKVIDVVLFRVRSRN